jgi:hypothetical protein
MKRLTVVFLATLLSATLSYGQASSVPQAPAPIAHGAFPVNVIKTLDSSKLNQDDALEMETWGSFKLPDGTLVPKGSKMMGRVVGAKARSKGDQVSELTLAFNKLNILGGKVLALKGTVQAVYSPAEEPTGPNMATLGTSRGGSMHGSVVGGGGVSPGGTGLTNSKNGSDMQSSSSPQTVVDTKAEGVQGMRDLSLDNGVLTSKGKSVKLGSGMRLIVRADIFG